MLFFECFCHYQWRFWGFLVLTAWKLDFISLLFNLYSQQNSGFYLSSNVLIHRYPLWLQPQDIWNAFTFRNWRYSLKCFNLSLRLAYVNKYFALPLFHFSLIQQPPPLKYLQRLFWKYLFWIEWALKCLPGLILAEVG